MNRRILISEDERYRILGLHENRKRKEWGFLLEQVDTSKVVAAYGSVEACKAAYNQEYLSGIAKKVTGQDYRVIQKKYLEAKCNGKTPCDNQKVSNNNLAMEICEGTFTLDGAATQTPTGPDIKTTFIVNGQKKTYATPEEITAAFQSGELNANTQVWSPTANLTTFTPIKDLPADNPLSAQFKPIMAQVAPEYKQSFTIKIIGADGKQVDMDNATIEKGIMDKTITAETPALDPTTNTWSKAGQIETLKPIFAKVVPDYKAPQAEIPSTGNKTLDEWLKTQAGQTYLSKKDRQSQEAFIDYLEQSGDPILASVGGKKELRKILLGDVNKDTKFGRWWQKNISNPVGNVVDVLGGKDVVANKGYNPNQPGQTTGGGGVSNPNTTNQTTYSPEEQKKFMDMASQMKLPRN